MPTGYTNVIDDNPDVTFEAFAWRCARAFGALVTMRDDPTGAPIPEELQPAPYYLDSVTTKRAAAQLAKAMTRDEAEVAMRAEAQETEARNAERRVEHEKKVAGYARMRAAVAKWKPPTGEHGGLRSFMLEQLDTGDPGDLYVERPFVGTVDEWMAEQVASAEKSLSYAETSLREEEERTRSRNAWLRALRESIGNPPATEAK